jgi:hypothetical protein
MRCIATNRPLEITWWGRTEAMDTAETDQRWLRYLRHGYKWISARTTT